MAEIHSESDNFVFLHSVLIQS